MPASKQCKTKQSESAQIKQFKATARELEYDEFEKAFEKALKKLVKPKSGSDRGRD